MQINKHVRAQKIIATSKTTCIKFGGDHVTEITSKKELQRRTNATLSKTIIYSCTNVIFPIYSTKNYIRSNNRARAYMYRAESRNLLTPMLTQF
jgi:hypothetical protein